LIFPCVLPAFVAVGYYGGVGLRLWGESFFLGKISRRNAFPAKDIRQKIPAIFAIF
jgi:hypothetical protein